MDKLEALALAISNQNQALDPGSEAFATLNPGLLRSYSVDQLNVITGDGTRIFSSFQGGYRALLANLEAKCQGKTRANGERGKLGPDSPLKDLIKTFRYVQTRHIIEMLQDSLEDKAIGENTPLEFFVRKNA